MNKHLTLLGAMYVGFNVISVISAFIVYTALAGSGILSGDEEAMTILSFIGTIIAYFLIMLALPGIIGGIALIKRKSWSRILVLILGFINLYS